MNLFVLFSVSTAASLWNKIDILMSCSKLNNHFGSENKIVVETNQVLVTSWKCLSSFFYKCWWKLELHRFIGCKSETAFVDSVCGVTNNWNAMKITLRFCWFLNLHICFHKIYSLLMQWLCIAGIWLCSLWRRSFCSCFRNGGLRVNEI